MALTNYSDLQTTIASYLARNDLTAQIPDFIKLTEAKLQRRFKGVTALSSGNNWLFTANPDVYLYGALLEAQPYLQDDARIATWAQIFEKVVAEVRRTDTTSGFSTYAALQAAIADWLDRPDIDVDIPNFIKLIEAKFKRKFKGVTSLSSSNTSNWLLLAHPDVYLYGSLLQSAPYLKDDPRVPVWEQTLNQLMAEIRLPDTASNFSNYTGLQAAIADWLNRPDLTTVIPNFIKLTEAKLQRRFVGVTALSSTNTTNTILTSHPDAYLYGALLEAEPYLIDDARIAIWKAAFETVLVDIRLPSASANFTNYTGLRTAIADWLDRPDLTNAIPNFIALAEAKLQRRFKDVTTLGVSASTNWLLTENPDVYLYGALQEAEPYLKDDVRLAIWKEAFERNVAEIRHPNASSSFADYAGLQLAVADWLGRTDLTDAIPNFIDLAEARFAIKFKSFTGLSVAAPTNSILTSYPDIYLYGTLVEAATYLQDSINLPIWKQELENKLSLIRVVDSATSLANYTGLQAAVIDWAERPDLTANVADFIQLAETKLQRRFKGVTTLTTGAPTNSLLTNYPDTYLYGSLVELAAYIKDEAKAAAWKAVFNEAVASVRLPDSTSSFANYTGLQAAVTDWLARPDLATAVPNFIRLAEAQFQRKLVGVTTLGGAVTTNWLLTAHPDIYLYGTLLESAPYLKDDARVVVWQTEYDRRIVSVRNPTTSGGFTTYTTLQATIADWLNRPDLTNVIPTFISLAEARLVRDLRIREMLKVSTAVTTSGDKTVGLPADFLQMRDLHIETNPIATIKYQSPSVFFRNSNASVTGLPTQYTTLASELQFAPVPDSAYTIELLYYAKPPRLSSSVSTNVFLTSCPDLLLYAALGESAPYLENDARITTWATLYDKGVNSLTISDDGGEYAGSPLTISITNR